MNAYANHLATVNEVQDVIASEDICNAQGQVLIKKGVALNAAMADRMARFKLQKPLESSIVIDNELNTERLLEAFEKYINTDSSMSVLHQKYDYGKELKSYCAAFCNFPILRQKLTVLSLITPNIFEQTLFCAWLGGLLCNTPGNSLGSGKEIFLAAMCHDIGMVHISADVLNKQDELSMEEWKQIQSHPVIGYNIVKDTEGMDTVVARAVLEHHENLDGTGYPRGLMANKLSNEGQLLNLLDSIGAIYTKYLKPFQRSLGTIIPIIQINEKSRYGLTAKKLIILFRELSVSAHKGIPNELAGSFISFAKTRMEYIIRCSEIAAELSTKTGFRHDDMRLASIQNAIIHMSMAIATSGIINDAYMRWLDQVASEELAHAYSEVEEAFMIMREIVFHLDRLKRQIQLYLDKPEDKEIAEKLQSGLTQLNEIHLPVVPNQLAHIWLFQT
jgi:HD domain